MRKAILLLTLLIASALRGDPTFDLLRGERVRQYVRLYPTLQAKKLDIRYAVDSTTDSFQNTLADTWTFRSNGPVSVRVANYNPLRTKVNSTLTSADDPNFGAIKGFLETALGVVGAIDPRAIQQAINVAAAAPAGSPCDQLDAELLSLWLAVLDNKITAADIEGWANAVGRAKIAAAAADAAQKQADLKANIDRINTGLGKIEEMADDDRTTAPAACTAIRAETLATILALARQASLAIAAKQQLMLEVAKIAKTLKEADENGVWFDGGSSQVRETDYEIAQLADSSKVRTLKVDMTQRTFAIEGRTFVMKDTANASRSLIFRHYSALVPEVGAAILLNRVEYPKYGTATNSAGQTVVARAGEDTNAYNAAATLNWIAPFDMGFVFPAFQIGVSTGKDAPGALAGIAARFFEPRNLSIGVGALFTFRKELDKLSVDSPISGTAALEEDLKIKSGPTSWYVALQYNF